jgi:hypothetical protein
MRVVNRHSAQREERPFGNSPGQPTVRNKTEDVVSEFL